MTLTNRIDEAIQSNKALRRKRTKIYLTPNAYACWFEELEKEPLEEFSFYKRMHLIVFDDDDIIEALTKNNIEFLLS